MPIPPRPLRFAVAEAALSFVGAAIAGTLWWAHRERIDLPCTADGGCTQIAASPQAYVTFGPWHDISVAFLGFLAYSALLTLSLLKLASDTPRALRVCRLLTWLVSAFGFLYSWRLQYIAHFQINAFCFWCFTSALVMTLLFLISTFETFPRHRHPSPNTHV